MGAYQVVITPYASGDLERIVRYIARNNPDVAQQFGEKLVDRALSLSETVVCQSGGRLPKRPGVRKLIEGNYLILYRVLPEQNKVRVLRFWHGAQDRAKLSLGE
ncbi:MAG: type II toxin-antitoxin system RelE/ParE family toxin [Methylacidiphilales bacterium]|nr:type II toxin-antitoxin system RelE/ParE family toxin [Candidatus Methylacidiphilales bacterium]